MTRAYVAAVTLLATIATTAVTQETTRVPVAPESKLWIEGTSNLHGWSCKAEKMDAAVELDAAAAAQVSVAQPKALKKVDVSGRPVLIARASEARELLPRALADRGAAVDVVALYETVREDPDPAPGGRS